MGEKKCQCVLTALSLSAGSQSIDRIIPCEVGSHRYHTAWHNLLDVYNSQYSGKILQSRAQSQLICLEPGMYETLSRWKIWRRLTQMEGRWKDERRTLEINPFLKCCLTNEGSRGRSIFQTIIQQTLHHRNGIKKTGCEEIIHLDFIDCNCAAIWIKKRKATAAGGELFAVFCLQLFPHENFRIRFQPHFEPIFEPRDAY